MSLGCYKVKYTLVPNISEASLKFIEKWVNDDGNFYCADEKDLEGFIGGSIGIGARQIRSDFKKHGLFGKDLRVF